MFVYHVEAFQKASPEKEILSAQLELMEARVFKIICNPAMNITWLFGLAMLYFYGLEWFKVQSWIHVKLALLIGLTFYHERNRSIIKKLKQGQVPMSAQAFRFYNEIPTLFLVGIVMLAVFKNTVNYLYLFLGIILFAVVLFALVKLYKRMRTN